MQRKCDGSDPNLRMNVIFSEDGSFNRMTSTQFAGTVDLPCDCGKSFDDEDRSVIYPHRPI